MQLKTEVDFWKITMKKLEGTECVTSGVWGIMGVKHNTVEGIKTKESK